MGTGLSDCGCIRNSIEVDRDMGRDLSVRQLLPGDVFVLPLGVKVQALVPKTLVFDNRPGDWSLVRHVISVERPFDYLVGRYVVESAEMAGGGTGHGPGDVFPDGWRVRARSLDNDNEIEFYQSGCFTHTISLELEIIGKARREWVFD